MTNYVNRNGKGLKMEQTDPPTNVISTAIVDAAMQMQRYAGSTLAQAAEAYVDAVGACAMTRALLAGMSPESERRPLAWDQMRQAEETEFDARCALQRALDYWRKRCA